MFFRFTFFIRSAAWRNFSLLKTGPYIPQTDAGARAFLNNFAARILSDPVGYGLTSNDAETLHNLARSYDEAYVRATEPLTRTVGTIDAKNAARNQAVGTFRIYAGQIRADRGVTNEQKLNLGLHIPDSTPSRIPAPETQPMLFIVSSASGVHTIRYADATTPNSRAKPRGYTSLHVYRNIGPLPSPDTSTLEFVAAVTRQPFSVTYDPSQTALAATYMAKWCNAKGETGPWGPPVSMTIAFGGPVEIKSQAA